MIRSTGLLVVLSLLSSSSFQRPSLQTLPIVVIKGGTLIDIRTGRQINDSLIVIEGNLITQVGREAQITVPRDARVIDAHNKWIIPGLMDMHSHTSSFGGSLLWLYVANGVTTVRDPGGDLSFLKRARQEIDSGKRLGPRLFFAGLVLDGNPPVWPGRSIIVETPEQAETTVNSLVDQGVDFIKVYNNITEQVLAAIIRTAHGRGVPVIGHVPRAMTMTRVVEMGLDGLEHIRITGRELLTAEEANKIDFLPFAQREALLWQKFDLGADKLKRLVAFLADKKVFLDPTLTIDEVDSLYLFEQESRDPNNRFLSRQSVDAAARLIPDMFKLPPELKTVAPAGFKKRMRFIEMCNHAGVQIIAGTDGAGLGKLLPGFGLHHELELLSRTGLSPLQVIQAATINAARAMKKEKELGSIEPGKLADIVILNSSPLIDIRNTSNIHGVITGGRVLDRKALDEMLTQGETAARSN